MDTLQARFRDQASDMLQATPTILVALGRGPTFSIETCYFVGSSDELFCIVKPHPAIVEAVRDDAHVAFTANHGFPNHMLQGTGRAFFIGSLDRHPQIREHVLAKSPDATPFLSTIRNLGVLRIVPDQIAITDDTNLGLGPRPVYVPEVSRALPKRRDRWLQAVGYSSWYLVLLPVLITGLLALNAPVSVAWLWCLPLFAAALLFHAGTTLLATYAESRRRSPRRASMGISPVLVEGLLPAPEVFWGGILCLGSAGLLGLLMAAQRGTPVLLLGLIGVMGGLLYAGWPLRLSSSVSDEAVVCLGLGPMLTMGSWYVLTGVYDHTPVVIGLALGLLAAAICHAGHLDTLTDDATSHNDTAAVRLGWEGARRLYYGLAGVPYWLVLIGLFANLLPAWAWLTFISVPLMARAVISVWRATPEQVQDLSALDKRTAQAYLGFGLSLALGLLLGYVS